MRITKFGHACVRFETGGHVVVLDPGGFTGPEAVDGATAVLITHEHADHYSPDHLRRTDAPVFTIGAVAAKIREDAPDVAERVTVVEPGQQIDVGVPVQVVGEKHAVIHPELPHFDNSGYLLEVEGQRVFHPGDSLTLPPADVDLLLPPGQRALAQGRASASTSPATSARRGRSPSTTRSTARSASAWSTHTSPGCWASATRSSSDWPKARTCKGNPVAPVPTSAADCTARGGAMIDPTIATEDERTQETPGVRQLPRMLAPFAIPAYRKMAVALSCGAFAYGVWTVALVWEVIRLGGGPAQLSIVSTAGAVGVLLPALLAGVVADRIPQKLIVMTVATAEAVSYTVVTVLSLADLTHLWHLAVVSLFIGMGMAFYYAAYSAWLPAIVPPSQLLAVNGFEGMVRPLVAQAVGPGVAGVVVGIASPGWACLVAAAVVAGSAYSSRSALPRTPVRRDLSVANRHPVRVPSPTCARASSTCSRRPGCSPHCCSPR